MRLPRGNMKVREVMKLIEKDGWALVRIKGDHRHYRHLVKRGIVTIAGHPGDDVKAGTLNSILKQAGLK
jgi:predicted RNA binding protein YcfA (HicA-like mRNA interferase family)